jgi:signal peptidase
MTSVLEHSTEAEEAGRRQDERSALTAIRSFVVTVAGVIGIACVIIFIVGRIDGLTLIVVTTGSMSPTIPTGSVVVSHREAASAVRVGQVVTVPRPGASLPVTHRVVRVSSVPGDPAARSLTLRGDANATDDRAPYVVRSVGVTVASARGVGSVLAVLTLPAAKGIVVAVVGLLVVWTFWPARRKRPAAGSA